MDVIIDRSIELVTVKSPYLYREALSYTRHAVCLAV